MVLNVDKLRELVERFGEVRVFSPIHDGRIMQGYSCDFYDTRSAADFASTFSEMTNVRLLSICKFTLSY